jgi:hypothetical protein
MNSYLIIDRRTGQQICECICIQDATMMVRFDELHREIRLRKVLLDQVVDVSSKRMDDDRQLNAQVILPYSDALPVAV